MSEKTDSETMKNEIKSIRVNLVFHLTTGVLISP